MMNVQNLMEYHFQQQIAYEIYRQQIAQRIPDPFMQMLPMPMSSSLANTILPARPTLPGTVKATLDNNRLWQQFHEIGTEMIITKNGRRMFPSVSIGLKGLEQDAQYCLLLEMLPIGDCRFKYSGSQWLPAGGAEPQSPQRMFLHPDSPASGAHWESQTISFNKIKLTNNTLDNNGHIVLASMHKYQPRIHLIKTKDLSELPWAPQQSFLFPETEFIAVTAYQNDRITKLKIDNNPFAKGFRESGQSKCKRKLMANNSCHSSPSPPPYNDDTDHDTLNITFGMETIGKRMRCTTASNIHMPEDTVYNCLTMDPFFLRHTPFYSKHTKIVTNVHAFYTDTPSNIPTHNALYSSIDSCQQSLLPSSHIDSPNRFNVNYSAEAITPNYYSIENDHKSIIPYSNNNNNIENNKNNKNNNNDTTCPESTTIAVKQPSNKTKSSNFSISAILAY